MRPRRKPDEMSAHIFTIDHDADPVVEFDIRVVNED